jgi:signal transduction histidine kinase
MALLYGGLVLLVAIFLLLVSLLLVDRSVSRSGLYAHPQQTVFTDPTRSDPVSVKVLRQQARHDVRDYLIQNGLIYFAIIVVVATLGGYLLAKSALRPIAKVTKTAQQLSTETLNQRIALGGPYDELRELADTFDEMLARLDAAFEGQRQFVANASHELRTPLSVISTELDVTLADPNASSEELRRMGEVVKAAADRAQRLVGSLLTLARLQAGVRGALEVNDPVDLAALVPTALAAVSVEASARLISIEQELAPARTLGDPRLLERLIGNLVENAVRHNVRSGWLRITSGESGGWAWLHVANGGPIIPQAEVM